MSRPVLLAAALLGGLGALGIAGWNWTSGWAPAADAYPFQGVDLDERAPPLDWAAVRASGAQFAYLTATAGTDARARAFEQNWAAIAEAGLRRGAVHHYSLCAGPVEQANAFNTVVPRDPDALPAAVDIGTDPQCQARPERAALVADLARFVATVEAHTGTPMLLRIAAPIERDYALSAALPRPLWQIRDWFEPDYAARPWRLWRASDMRRIDGVDEPLNWDVVAK